MAEKTESQLKLPLHSVTPLIESFRLTKHVAGVPVYLKCENCQPSGSFKLRGIGNVLVKGYEAGNRNAVIASGGSAGLAVAYAARELGMEATVIIPQTAPQEIVPKLEDLDVNIKISGRIWDESNREALQMAATKPGTTYLHAFDDPILWEGHSSMSLEIKEQLGGVKPSCVVLAVGGGGLFVGVALGLKKCGWSDVPIIAVETKGADNFNLSLHTQKVIRMDKLTSIAKTLSPVAVCQRVFDCAFGKEHPTISVVVTDDEALDACYNFIEDHRFMVEPACGAPLAALYSGYVQRLVEEGRICLQSGGPVVVIVCGGAAVSLKVLGEFRKELDEKKKNDAPSQPWSNF